MANPCDSSWDFMIIGKQNEQLSLYVNQGLEGPLDLTEKQTGKKIRYADSRYADY